MTGFMSVLSGVLWSSCNITTCLVFVVTFLVIYMNTRRRAGTPPGPPLMPVVGNLFSLAGSNTLKILDDLKDRYGEIYGLYIGTELTIVLNGYEAIHDALVKKASLFSVRPMSSFQKMVVKEPAVIYANGQLWKEQRKFCMEKLNELYVNKVANNVENVISEETEHLVRVLGTCKSAVDIAEYVNVSVSNVMCTILFNERFDFDDDRFKRVLERYNEGAVDFARTTVVTNCFPFVQYLPGDLLGVKKVERRAAVNFSFLEGYFDKRREILDDCNISTIVDKYHQAIKDNEEMCLNTTFTKKQMRSTISDLLAAGSETTATTIRWLILYILRNPAVQRRLHEDIDAVLGKSRQPSWSDKQDLPYVEATILETLRIASIAPLSIPHSVIRDCIFHGYLLPENCSIMVNINSVHMDKNTWTDPGEFRPERFLTADGKGLHVPKELVPFSLGPRACLGESVARMELFLFVTALFQKFELHLPAGAEVPDNNGNLGLTYSPSPFLVCVDKR